LSQQFIDNILEVGDSFVENIATVTSMISNVPFLKSISPNTIIGSKRKDVIHKSDIIKLRLFGFDKIGISLSYSSSLSRFSSSLFYE
jgi:hypothetical protein